MSARRALKRIAICLYCHGVIPSAIVSRVFAAFNLRSC
jgi:hypothetical protein